jgi:hypothetical protein
MLAFNTDSSRRNGSSQGSVIKAGREGGWLQDDRLMLRSKMCTARALPFVLHGLLYASCKGQSQPQLNANLELEM